MRRRDVFVVFAVCLLVPVMTAPAYAQLADPGDGGVVMGHIHFTVRDVDATRRLWLALGGTPVQNGQLQLIQFPGAFVLLRQGEPTGIAAESAVNHVGFLVKNANDSFAKWEAAGVKVERGANGRGGNVITPDGVRIEITQDGSINVPIKMHHIHFFIASPLETQAWYGKTFGAVPGKRGQDAAADLPGVNLTFRKVDVAPAGTKGRTIDHIGFEIKNLEQFCKKLEATGLKLDRPYTRLPNSMTAIAFLTDPFGTYIELTENLAPPMK